MLPRVLPKIQSFGVRVDSSLGEGSAIPTEVAESLAAEAMSIAAEDGNTTTDVCLRLLPRLQETAAKHVPGQVRLSCPFSIKHLWGHIWLQSCVRCWMYLCAAGVLYGSSYRVLKYLAALCSLLSAYCYSLETAMIQMAHPYPTILVCPSFSYGLVYCCAGYRDCLQRDGDGVPGGPPESSLPRVQDQAVQQRP